eukprot:7342009-Alexandrium_andersonii.AAC.1
MSGRGHGLHSCTARPLAERAPNSNVHWGTTTKGPQRCERLQHAASALSMPEAASCAPSPGGTGRLQPPRPPRPPAKRKPPAR